jgi:sulfate adenylyltransferase large subunit
MNALADPALFDADDFVVRQERKDLLRFIVCGSVDHGKSPLIGRLLYESGLLFADQLEALDRESPRYSTQDDQRDFALLLDGLAAEREQKITIDVAYRFFTTARRKFIVADAPGHEQYTRNMATGASTADLAVLLVSAPDGLTRQTRRHALVAATLGVRRFVVVINKMDAAARSERRFASLVAEFRDFAQRIEIDELFFIPLSARNGDNLVFRSQLMPWYDGPSLLEYLETVEIAPRRRDSAFRMPIQWVNRPDSRFRGYCGLIASGKTYPGMPVQALPSGQSSRIARIVTTRGDLAHAISGQAVTLTLSDEIDASRGDVLAAIGPFASVTDRLVVRLVWTGTDELQSGRPYLLSSRRATVEPVLHVIDLETNRFNPTDRLATNDIGTAVIKLDRLVAADRYEENRDTGGFILIDPETCDTVGLGIIETISPGEDQAIARTKLLDLIRATETHARSIAKAVSWRATGSLDTFIIAALVTGSSRLAGGVAVAEILTKTILYYVHERVWAFIGWGKR